MQSTPKSLLDRLRVSPEETDWRKLVDLYTPFIQSWLRQHDVAAADIDDVLQETFAILIRKLPTFEHNQRAGAFRRWLRSISINCLRAFQRSRQPSGKGAASLTTADVLEQVPDPESDLDRYWDQKHDEFIVQQAMALVEREFTRSTWQAFRRQVMDGAKPAEVANELGLTRNAVVLAEFRVFRRLRQELRGLID
jgi:RNA polymerase sigma-70 factor, ECF subfamily